MFAPTVCLAPVAIFMLISAVSSETTSCGSGTVLKNGQCVVDTSKIGAARMKTVDGGIELSVGGATLRLSAPVLPADQDEDAKVYCQGEFVTVDSLGRCVPKVEYLQLGDTRINMADLVTSPDLKELGEEIEKGTDTKLEDAGKELTKELNENVDRLDVKTAAADKVNEDAIEKLEGYVNGAFKTKVNEDRKEAISAATSVLDESIKEDINPKLKTAQNDITALETKNTAQDKSITDGFACTVKGQGFADGKCVGVESAEIYPTCLAWLKAGHKKSGVYLINFGGLTRAVYCDQTGDGGGWLLAARIKYFSRKHLVEGDYLTSTYDPITKKLSLVKSAVGGGGAGKTPDAGNGCLHPDGSRPCKLSDNFINRYAVGARPDSTSAKGNGLRFQCMVPSPYDGKQFFSPKCRFSGQNPIYRGGTNNARSRDNWECHNFASSATSTNYKNGYIDSNDCGLGGHAGGSTTNAAYGWHACVINYFSRRDEVENEMEDLRYHCTSACNEYSFGCGHNDHGNRNGRRNQDGFLWIR